MTRAQSEFLAKGLLFDLGGKRTNAQLTNAAFQNVLAIPEGQRSAGRRQRVLV